MIGRRGPEAGAAESEELERLCDELGRFEAPFDEIARSRAEARLAAQLAREPARRHRRALGWTTALVVVGAAAAVALVARTVVPAARSRVANRTAASLRFEPYVVAPVAATAGSAVAATAVPEALVQPTSRLDVPAGWLVRASLGDAIAITLTGPARAWAETAADSAAESVQTVVHLEQGRLLASLEGGAGRRLEIVSPGAVTDVVGTLFSVEVVDGASRVAVAHGRVRVGAAPDSSGAQPRGPREITAGQTLADDAGGAGRARARAGRGAGGPRADTAAARGDGAPVHHRGASGGRGLGREAADCVRAGVGARRAARGRPAVGAGTGCGVAAGGQPAAPALATSSPASGRRRAQRGRPDRARCPHHRAPR